MMLGLATFLSSGLPCILLLSLILDNFVCNANQMDGCRGFIHKNLGLAVCADEWL